MSGLRWNKKFATPTHNSSALLRSEHFLKNDDGHAVEAPLILRVLKRENLDDDIVVVSRWSGGTPLSAKRFPHVHAGARVHLDTR
ncbi:YigZ family protein [Rubellimicrobium roseum]|uniref:YigZ family protein n=1 Tax=Rubellimicrobium roseum TaxID=687525 RepID=UPI001FE99A55|nr:YigZ family protein [Rubellimicrobium roseum]